MIPFRERNKTVIGTAGIVTLAAAVFGAFNLGALTGGEEYQAYFTEAAGLKPEDEVRVAGVKVGKVLDIDLDDAKVLVTFRSDVELGTQSAASIRIKTLLGRKFLMVTPEGEEELDEPIPLERTTSPFDITDAFRDLAETTDEIDTAQLAQSFTTLADTFRETPDEVRVSLEGLSRISNTIASRDAQLSELLERARGVTDVLAARDQDLVALMSNASLVLQELEARRADISRLLDTTTQLSEQLIALVRENRADLQPTLRALQELTALLERNSESIAAAIERYAPFARVFANNLGNGRWFDTIVYNLTTPTLLPGCYGEGRQVELVPNCPGEQVYQPNDTDPAQPSPGNEDSEPGNPDTGPRDEDPFSPPEAGQ